MTTASICNDAHSPNQLIWHVWLARIEGPDSIGPSEAASTMRMSCPESQSSARTCTCTNKGSRGHYWHTGRPYPIGHRVTAGMYALELAEFLSHRQKSEVPFN